MTVPPRTPDPGSTGRNDDGRRMLRRRRLLLGAGVGVGALAFLLVVSPLAHSAATELAATRAADRVVAAAEAFIATLGAEEREAALRDFDHDDRYSWYFTPVERNGLPLRDMSFEQRSAALALLQAVTSGQGFQKATGVMRLEEILAGIENNPVRRDPENYHFWVFGTPSIREPWGWRFEGHHVSLNFTSAGGVVVSNPSFIGANPAQVRGGPHAGWRLLAHEEDRGRALMRALDAEQRAVALISETAPRDIITGNDRRALLERVEGLAFGAMSDAQQHLFLLLLGEYVDNLEPELARERLRRIEETGFRNLHFAWAGSVEPGEPHYYRIHGPVTLIEYDNVQNNANHIHTVWRDLENDFGEDLLRRHYERAGPEHGHGHAEAGGQGHSHDAMHARGIPHRQ